jgi:hypothetical protein
LNDEYVIINPEEHIKEEFYDKYKIKTKNGNNDDEQTKHEHKLKHNFQEGI